MNYFMDENNIRIRAAILASTSKEDALLKFSNINMGPCDNCNCGYIFHYGLDGVGCVVCDLIRETDASARPPCPNYVHTDPVVLQKQKEQAVEVTEIVEDD